ncbi:MAG: hypothetical protein P1V20_29885, partial [Verrucomicrobiales bacterium]|nr:hypothetical protein [Verrucomicrobiales bacterium]
MKVTANTSRTFRGISTLEVMITLACLAALSALGVGAYVKIGSLTKEAKLENDIQILNTAINGYINFGGNLSDSETTESVVRKLKSRASKDTARTVVGMSQSFLDPRLDIVMQSPAEAESDMPRIYYDSAKKKFATTTTGPAGIRAFELRDITLEEDEQ